jgi:hypothetical protein
MLGGACVIGWRLNADRHADIRRQLETIDGAEDAEHALAKSSTS